MKPNSQFGEKKLSEKSNNNSGGIMRAHVTHALIAVAMIGLELSMVCQSRAPDKDLRMSYQLAVSGVENPEVVHTIAASGTKDVVRLLAGVAGTSRAAFANREAAINELARIGTEEALDSIAHLLAPHNSVLLLKDAARVLRTQGCSERCIESVLFYLYRLSRESPTVVPGDDSFASSLRKQESDREGELVSDLHSILLHNKVLTLSALAMSYGLGTEKPSRFALEIVQALHLREGCDLLLHSEHGQQQLKKFGVADPAVVTGVIDSLGCRGPAGPG